MSNNPRDTQFQGFADLLFDELREAWLVDWKFDDNMRKIIAQRAYDLASHILSHATETMIAECELPSCIPECVESLPDLTAWPEQQHEEGGTA